MAEIGIFFSCEERSGPDIVHAAAHAERAGFRSAWISDHFHPWNDAQGQSPFVWSVIGALSQVTRLPVTTAVTAPTMRIHPAIIAQAAATSAVSNSSDAIRRQGRQFKRRPQLQAIGVVAVRDAGPRRG